MGAANDNLFKFAFTVLVTYELQVGLVTCQSGGLGHWGLVHPALSAVLCHQRTTGRQAGSPQHDDLAQAGGARHHGAGRLGFFAQNIPVLLACIFLMGLQSTVFGPVKFAYLPQHLTERELTGGNGMVEMGTFVAILMGNVAGGLIIATPEIGAVHVGFSCIGLALIGRIASHYIPSSPAQDPSLVINWNPFTETWRNLQLARQRRWCFARCWALAGCGFLARCF